MIETPRRIHRRTAHQAATPVLDSSTGRFLPGRSRDVSHSGVFIELKEPPPVGTLVDMFIGGIGVGIQVLGGVVRVVPGVGFGATFTSEAASVGGLLRGARGFPS